MISGQAPFKKHVCVHILMFLGLLLSLMHCRPRPTTGELTRSDSASSLSDRTDELFHKINDRYLNNSGLKGTLLLVHGQLVVLGKIPPTNIQEELETLALIGLIFKEERAIYGNDFISPPGSLLMRTKRLSSDTANIVQTQSTKRGLQFKVQLIRAILQSNSKTDIPPSDGTIFDEVETLAKSIEALPELPSK